MSKQTNPLWTAYNNTNNEGGEGYNPHDQYIATGDGEPEWSKLDDQAYRLQNILNCTRASDHRYNDLTEELKTVQAAYEIAKALDI